MKKILLVIDAQEGFMVPGITDPQKVLLDQLLEKKLFDCVISSIYRNDPGNNIVKFMGWKQLMTAEEQQVTPVVAAHTHHYVTKTKYSAFCPELVQILKEANGGVLPECVFVAGFDTECCVLMSAVDLFEAGIRPIVLSRYCGASGGEEAQLAGLRTMRSLIGDNNICSQVIGEAADLDAALAFAENLEHVTSDPTPRKAQRLVEKLLHRGWRVSFAESCTGGKAAAALIDVPSASGAFDVSFVTYANDAKIRYVDVSADTITAHGVVSEEVAGEMAAGAAKAAKAKVGVGISGIAGPSGATANKPVGMVCFGFYVDGKTVTRTMQFGAVGRNAVRQLSVDYVYDTLLALLD